MTLVFLILDVIKLYFLVLQQTLPAEVFTLLIHRMREFQSEVSQATPGLKLAESTNDDLE